MWSEGRTDPRDYQLTGNEHGKEVMIEASESMLDRYNPVVSVPVLYANAPS